MPTLSELWSDLRYRVRAILRRGAMERDLETELRYHLEQEAAKYERTGLSRAEALRRARIAFGGMERAREECRDARGTVLIDTTIQDLRYALRGLRARPGFTAGVVLTLALGLGASTTMYGILDRLLFRPPAYLRDPGRVHRVYMVQTEDRRQEIDDYTSVARLLDVRRQAHLLSNISGFTFFHIAVGDGDAVHEYVVAGVSATYFDLFGARPALGRFFAARDDSMPTGAPVAVLGHAYWQAAFGGRPDVLGRTLRIGRGLFTIVGVAPKDFVGLDDNGVPAIYLPLSAFAWNLRPEDHARDFHWQVIQMVVKRAPGVSVAAAAADLSRAVAVSRLGERPDDPAWARQVAGQRPHVVLGPVQASRAPVAGADVKVMTWVTGVALVVLLVACANVASLLLARAVTRRREIALRIALGVSRGRLVRQLLAESLLLTTLGGLAGLAVAQWGGALARSLFLPEGTEASVVGDPRTLAGTMLAILAVAVATGLAPIAYALRTDLSPSLHDGARGASARTARLRAGLLVCQAALSVVLLVGAGLFVRSLVRVRHLHLGFDADRVLAVTENMRGVRLSTTERLALEQRLTDAARALPGVIAATPAPTIPFWAFEGRDLFVAGIDSVSLLGSFTMQAGNADYFRVMGTRILRGRGFTSADRATSPRVTVVSDGMARVLWPGENPIGKCIRIRADTMPCTRVVGVAEDLHARSLTARREFTYYVPIAQFDDTVASMLLVRVAGSAVEQADAVRRALQRVMPGAAYVGTVPLRSIVDPSMRSWRLGATMFVAFGALAVVLAGVGLYGVVAYGVAQRRREFGVRIALGAPGTHVLSLVVRSGMRLVIAGVVLGSAAAALAGHWASGLLFHESSTDPVVYGSVAAVLLLVAVAAMSVPALTAVRVDPNVALRAE